MQTAESRPALVSVDEIAAETGMPLRTVRRRIARLGARGVLSVQRVKRAGERRWRLCVDASSWARLCAGETARAA